MTSFNDFGLAEPILRALAEEDYRTPTPIQAQTIPLALERRDIVGIAQTGTGKTAAFALPILHHLQANRRRPERKSCRVLVLSPTRELSGQIETSFRTYGRHVRVSTTLAIGGVPMGKQVRALMDGVDVLVATPGRLLDLVKSNAARLGDVEVLVLDEADRMLDMGFIADIRKIVAKLPKQRQTLFFSATMPKAIADLAEHMLINPARVAVTPNATTAERIAQRVIHVDRAAKPAVLADVLRGETDIDRTLVFTRTKHGADKVVRSLEKFGIAAAAIHGNKSQGQRERVLAQFRAGTVRTLIATDIAARGIDVDGITHVINYDLPNIPESYVHRIGRTARAGAEGIAISLCDHEERAFLRDIEKLIRMPIPSTDQRSQPGQARPAGERTGAPPQKKSRQWKPNGERSGQPSRKRNDDQRPRHARPGEGDGRRDQQARADQPHRQDRNDRPQRQDRPQHQDRPQRQDNPNRSQRQDRPQRADRPQQHGNGEGGIAAVAFMQHGPRSERNSDRRAPR